MGLLALSNYEPQTMIPSETYNANMDAVETLVNGQLADVNIAADARIAVTKLARPPSCRVHKTNAQEISPSSWTALNFGTERWDTNNMHSEPNETRITIRTAGKYLLGGSVNWENAPVVFATAIAIRLNGNTWIGSTGSQSVEKNNDTLHHVTTFFDFNVNDYAEMLVWHNASDKLDVQVDARYSPEFWAVRLST